MEYKRVEVEWMDAQSSMQSLSLEEIKQLMKPLNTVSVGMLVYEHKDYVVLGFTDFGDGLMKHHQLIPRGMIKKITELVKV